MRQLSLKGIINHFFYILDFSFNDLLNLIIRVRACISLRRFMMKLTWLFCLSVLLTVGLTVSSTNASVIYTDSNVSGGLSLAQEPGSSFGPISTSSGQQRVENNANLMSNDLRWNFDAQSAKIVSTMSGGPNKSNAAYLLSSWTFQVVNSSVDYKLYASADQINSRFQDITTGMHLLPGEGNWIYAGSYSGTLLPGHEYYFDLQSTIIGDSTVIFQVAEPSVLLLLLLAVMVGIKRKSHG